MSSSRATAPRPSPARLRLQAVPFQHDDVMDGPPSCSRADFERPRLRRCPFDPATISWENAEKLGLGLDGCVWRVNFGSRGPFVIKVFWDAGPPSSHHYYAAQRECQNSALLQMMETAVKDASVNSNPVLVHDNPTTLEQAAANLLSFSDEARQGPLAEGSELKALRCFPRMATCYGWLRFDTSVFSTLPAEVARRVAPRSIYVSETLRSFPPNSERIAIVYEYIEDGENSPASVEQVADFLWRAGFCHGLTPHAKNWKGSVLVDISEIIHPGGFGWHRLSYGRMEARELLRDQFPR